MTNEELLVALDGLRNTLIAVATGGPRINDANDQYQRSFAAVAAELARRRIENPITYGSLWDWYVVGRRETFQHINPVVISLVD